MRGDDSMDNIICKKFENNGEICWCNVMSNVIDIMEYWFK